MVQTLVHWLLETIGTMGYPGIFLLMAMESSIIPVPSELVMPPAGYQIHQGRMAWLPTIMSGTLGSLVGAYINYFVAHYLGRPLILKYGRYVLIPPDKFKRVEAFFLQHGEISTFIGRLLPVVRHLISIPAGVAGMCHVRFSLYTLLGAGLWCSILTWIGYVIGQNQALVMAWSHRALVWVLLACAVLVACYVWWHRRRTFNRIDS